MSREPCPWARLRYPQVSPSTVSQDIRLLGVVVDSRGQTDEYGHFTQLFQLILERSRTKHRSKTVDSRRSIAHRGPLRLRFIFGVDSLMFA